MPNRRRVSVKGDNVTNDDLHQSTDRNRRAQKINEPLLIQVDRGTEVFSPNSRSFAEGKYR